MEVAVETGTTFAVHGTDGETGVVPDFRHMFLGVLRRRMAS